MGSSRRLQTPQVPDIRCRGSDRFEWRKRSGCIDLVCHQPTNKQQVGSTNLLFNPILNRGTNFCHEGRQRKRSVLSSNYSCYSTTQAVWPHTTGVRDAGAAGGARHVPAAHVCNHPAAKV